MKFNIIEMFVGRNPYPFYIFGADPPSDIVKYGYKYLDCKDYCGEWAVIKHEDIVSVVVYQEGTEDEIMDTWNRLGR